MLCVKFVFKSLFTFACICDKIILAHISLKSNCESRHSSKRNVCFGKVYMKAKQFILNVGDQTVEVFTSEAFFQSNAVSSPIHSHHYTELHFTSRGECRIYTVDRELVSTAGSVIVIPAGNVHRLKIDNASVRHSAVMINYPLTEVIEKHFPSELLAELDEAIHTAERPVDVSELAAYLSFICASFVKPRVKLENVCNREFLLYEFFAGRYNQSITVKDLAAVLSLSEKQTARLVEKYMGKSFSKVLTSYRINAAKLLMQSDRSMTMTEIAAAVGYSSYSGFWKAFKGCKNDANCDVSDASKPNP